MGKIILKSYAKTREDLVEFQATIDAVFPLSFHSEIRDDNRTDEFWAKSTVIVGQDPATKKQLDTLDSMDVLYQPDITKSDASRLIRDQITRKATK